MLHEDKINPHCKICFGRGYGGTEEIPCVWCWDMDTNANFAPVSRLDLLNILTDFHFALMDRQDCQKCLGYGIDLDDLVAEPLDCECTQTAKAILDQHEEAMGPIISEYLFRNGIDTKSIDKWIELNISQLLEDMREAIEDG